CWVFGYGITKQANPMDNAYCMAKSQTHPTGLRTEQEGTGYVQTGDVLKTPDKDINSVLYIYRSALKLHWNIKNDSGFHLDQSAVSVYTVVNLASYIYYSYKSGQGGIKRTIMLLIISLHQSSGLSTYLSLEEMRTVTTPDIRVAVIMVSLHGHRTLTKTTGDCNFLLEEKETTKLGKGITSWYQSPALRNERLCPSLILILKPQLQGTETEASLWTEVMPVEPPQFDF
ncbi:hypothetical protein STEG23_033974, partial [Scotinomys teguina]